MSRYPHPFRPLSAVLLACLMAAAASARVGESVASIKERFGKPDPKSPKNMVIWFIEASNGPLVYTVTYNAKGFSIAEGLKPLKTATLTAESAKNFIQDQVALIKDSSTTRVVKPREKYAFGGQAFMCAEDEFVVLDQANDLLIVWSRGGVGSVLAVSREMLQPAGP